MHTGWTAWPIFPKAGECVKPCELAVIVHFSKGPQANSYQPGVIDPLTRLFSSSRTQHTTGSLRLPPGNKEHEKTTLHIGTHLAAPLAAPSRMELSRGECCHQAPGS